MAEPDTADRGHAPPRPPGGGGPRLRSLLHQAVPNHFQDPVGLALRILRSGNADAVSALLQAGAKLGLVPADALLTGLTRLLGEDDAEPSRPILFVTGPPRSGTTLLHQSLIRALPVAYVSNLASLLPRSAASGAFPLAAAIANDRVRLESYYGRTRALSGPSDGLEFWDRWLGPDRRAIPSEIAPAAAREMRRFFGRLERRTSRPVVAKNNNLLGSAHLVAEVLPTARFVCLRRDPLYLAQSLLKARRDIQGSSDVSYGIDEGGAAAADPVEDVLRQVRFYEKLEAAQAARLGAERFLVVGYEELCADPTSVVRLIGRTVFGFEDVTTGVEPLRPSRTRTLADEEFERLSQRLGV
jgi:hypothetical protein